MLWVHWVCAGAHTGVPRTGYVLLAVVVVVINVRYLQENTDNISKTAKSRTYFWSFSPCPGHGISWMAEPTTWMVNFLQALHGTAKQCWKCWVLKVMKWWQMGSATGARFPPKEQMFTKVLLLWVNYMYSACLVHPEMFNQSILLSRVPVIVFFWNHYMKTGWTTWNQNKFCCLF